MERGGFVTRRRDRTNRRVHLIELTKSGETAFVRLGDAAVTFDRRLPISPRVDGPKPGSCALSTFLPVIKTATGDRSVDYAGPPERLVGGFWAELVAFRTGAPDGMSGDLVARVMPDPALARKETAVQAEVAASGFATPAVRLSGDPRLLGSEPARPPTIPRSLRVSPLRQPVSSLQGGRDSRWSSRGAWYPTTYVNSLTSDQSWDGVRRARRHTAMVAPRSSTSTWRESGRCRATVTSSNQR
jgi:hypothetical protein